MMYRSQIPLILVMGCSLFVSCDTSETPEPPPPPPPPTGAASNQAPGHIPGQPQAPISGQQHVPVSGQQQVPVSGQQHVPVSGQQQVPVSGQQQAPVPEQNSDKEPSQPEEPTISVTLTANSTPPGATVIRPDGEILGTTPLVTAITILSAQAGMPQTFTFNLAGYQPTTASAVALNNAIMVQATLSSSGATGVPRSLTVTGRGGGRINDFRTAVARATVEEPCIIQSISVTLRGSHSFYRDLTVSIRGPNDQRATLHNKTQRNPFRTYMLNRINGTQAQGEWRAAIRDSAAQDTGRFSGFTMNLSCQ